MLKPRKRGGDQDRTALEGRPGLIGKCSDGGPEFKELRAKGEAHPIEQVGPKLRSMFVWGSRDEDYQEGSAAR